MSDLDQSTLDAVPITVKQVSIQGNKSVDTELIEQQLHELRHARNFGQLHQLSSQTLQQLKDLDLFTSCDIAFDKSSGSVSQSGINARATVRVEEKSESQLQAARCNTAKLPVSPTNDAAHRHTICCRTIFTACRG